MKLTWTEFDLQLAHKWTIARTTGTDIAKVIVVQLTAADGTIGLGEAAPTARYKESVKSVDAFLKKVDPRGLSFSDLEGSMAYLETISRHDMSAKCALNLALLDGAGKKAKKPVHDLLGLGFREHHHQSSFTIGLDTPEVIRSKVERAANYPILKMKVGGPDDQANLQALRQVAPQKTVRVDANEGWKTKEQALQMIEWLAQDKNIQYVEQPLPASAPAKDWVWLKERTPLPIFGDESYHSAKDIETAAQCFHGVNVKLVKTGGVSNGLAALMAARKAGLKTMIGCMIETSILISAAAQLAELCDYLDVDGNVLITNDPYRGVENQNGTLSFAGAPEKFGLRVAARR
jgi:L-alanine-DL-glutamate epimerase-like enolase superfamily enzyme